MTHGPVSLNLASHGRQRSRSDLTPVRPGDLTPLREGSVLGPGRMSRENSSLESMRSGGRQSGAGTPCDSRSAPGRHSAAGTPAVEVSSH